jgi:membrane fusion protein (multidrug efflux system)
VSVELTGFARDSALAVPQRAVQQALGRQYVLVVGPGDTVASRDIETGQWNGSRWIIEKGLAAGDRVIVDGAQKAAPGQPVRPVPAAATDTLASGVPSTARGTEAK